MKSRPLISIIVPVFNLSDVLTDTLESVAMQSYENWECIIVNDGSIDNSEEIALKFISNKPKFEYYNKINGGVASARNFGAEKSKGDYLIFLDGDDLIEKRFVELLTKKMFAHPNSKIVYSDVEFFEAKQGVWDLPPYNYKALLLDSMICA
ncbi:MAG: glycosyltransferase family A protein, partial [Cytophagales bacterium]